MKERKTRRVQAETFVLYVDRSSESAEAYDLLKMAKLPFRTERSTGFGLPALRLGDTTYRTLAGVEKIVRGLAPEAFERYLRGEGPDAL